MLTLLNQLFSPAKPAAAVTSRQGVASNLMDRAEACAGQDPQRAAIAACRIFSILSSSTDLF